MPMSLWAGILAAGFAAYVHAQSPLAPTGTLRAAYLASNAAQAVRDPATGEVRGVAADLTRELARRSNIPSTIAPLANPQAVIDAIAHGQAEIGFVAYAPARTGTVLFSPTYLLTHQSFLVPPDSPLRSVDDIDRPGVRLSGTRNDSIMLYLARTVKQAKLVDSDGTPADVKAKFTARLIDGFGANIQRLTSLQAELPGYRILTGSLLDVPQTIIVPKNNAAALATVNAFLDDVRRAGFLKSAIDRSRIIGIAEAPAGYGYGKVE
jgi:polar amino acid transport system substrate-binding protein